MLDLLPPLAADAGAIRLDELPARTGLEPRVVRLLVLFDIIQPCGAECSFRDLIGAREAARLLGEGLALADIVRGTERLGRAGEDSDAHPLARLKLACDDSGRLARRIGDAFAELDGQLRLALPYADNPSVDELFDAADEAEQAGDLATAAMLYRRCVSMDQRDPIAPFNLANVLREQGQRAAAKLFFELALAIDPEFADAWYNLALLEEAAGDKDGRAPVPRARDRRRSRLRGPTVQPRQAAVRAGLLRRGQPDVAALPGARPRQRMEPARPLGPAPLPAAQPADQPVTAGRVSARSAASR